MLFDVAVIQKPKPKEVANGKEETLLYGPKPVIAKDRKAAEMKALQGLKDLTKLDMQFVEILVRPFTGG